MGRRRSKVSKLAKSWTKNVRKVNTATQRTRDGFHKTVFDNDPFKNPVMGTKRRRKKG